MHNKKIQHFLRKYSFFKKNALNHFIQAKKNELKSHEELEKLNWEKAQRILCSAYANVPWYRDKFKAIGIHPSDISKKEYFYQLPILKRKDIIENFDKFFDENISKKIMKISSTGGSTGEPLKIGMTPGLNREIQKWQMLSWWGISPNDDMALIYRKIPTSFFKRMAINFINYPGKILHLDATNLSKTNFDIFLKSFNFIKPKLIHGYVGAIDALCDYVLVHKLDVHKPKLVTVTASPISKIQEQKIIKVFGSPICNQYGCSEVYYIAAESPEKVGLHIFSDSVNVEVLDKKNHSLNNSLYGKIVLTNLNEYGFPLIRYENGDSGRLLKQNNNLKINYPLLDKIKGRISDNITLPDGTVLAGEFLTTIFDDYVDQVRQFQIIHKKNKNIEVRLSLKEKIYFDRLKKHTIEILNKRIKNQVKIVVLMVNNIDPYKGKLRFIIKETS